MGQCYSVNLKLKYKDEQKVYDALRWFVDNSDDRYGEDTVVSVYGFNTKELFGLLTVIFGNLLDSGNEEEFYSTDGWGRHVFNSSFSSSYSWHYVLEGAFFAMSPYLESCSSLDIYPDEGKTSLRIKNGKVVYL